MLKKIKEDRKKWRKGGELESIEKDQMSILELKKYKNTRTDQIDLKAD